MSRPQSQAASLAPELEQPVTWQLGATSDLLLAGAVGLLGAWPQKWDVDCRHPPPTPPPATTTTTTTTTRGCSVAQ